MSQIKQLIFFYLSLLGLVIFAIFIYGFLGTFNILKTKIIPLPVINPFMETQEQITSKSDSESSASILVPVTNNNSQAQNNDSIKIDPKKGTEGPYKKTNLIITPKIPVTLGAPNSTLKWGAYVGSGLNDLATFEKLTGKAVDIQAYFVGWGENFPSEVAAKLKSSGKTLLIFWEPYSTTIDSIDAGDTDEYIKKFAAQVKSYGGPVILIPFPEMNGNWEPWSGYNSENIQINTPDKIIAVWKHLHGFFNQVPNVKFGWAVNNVSVPDVGKNNISLYYPGDSYVDYVGVDGFNFNNPWQTFGQVFDNAISKISIYKKPIYIFSMACVADSKKAAWIAEGLGAHLKNYKLAGWVWFNQNGADGNWLINSDKESLAAFKTVLPF